MARLSIYTVHINPSLPHAYEAPEFVPEGFSFRAFFITMVWLLYYRLWGAASGLLLYNALMLYLFTSDTFSHASILIIDIGVHLVIGFEANEWRRARLKRLGYLTCDITTGDSSLRAEQRFFDRYFAGHAAA